MKKVFLTFAFVALMAVGASAQMPSSPVSLYVGGALSLPQSPDDFSETYKTGYHGFAGVGFSFIPKLQVIGKIEYNTFSFDFDNNAIPGLSGGGTQNLLMFGADGRFSLGVPAAPFKPFVFAGAGLANISLSDWEGDDLLLATSLNEAMESQTEMYFNLGAGAEFKMGPMMSFFAQARYVSVQTEGDAASFIPVSVGLKFF
ncbi:outer membrane beta-barrel protein [candidate division GN15 bacterium]|nr:outer membrane beta-barrel protein [candidate division GN15 bacterium]